MITQEKLYEIAAGEEQSYTIRKNALLGIRDEQLVYELSEKAEDDWIRLEAACLSHNIQELKELSENLDERICLEAAIELKDEKKLTELASGSHDPLITDIALNNIESAEYLLQCVNGAVREWTRIEAGLRLCDVSAISALKEQIKDEFLLLRIAIILDDKEMMEALAVNSHDLFIKAKAEEWLGGMDGDTEDAID